MSSPKSWNIGTKPRKPKPSKAFRCSKLFYFLEQIGTTWLILGTNCHWRYSKWRRPISRMRESLNKELGTKGSFLGTNGSFSGTKPLFFGTRLEHDINQALTQSTFSTTKNWFQRGWAQKKPCQTEAWQGVRYYLFIPCCPEGSFCLHQLCFICCGIATGFGIAASCGYVIHDVF